MCAISGLLNINGKAKKFDKCDIEGIKRAVEVQRHRGPDDQGICAFDYQKECIFSENKQVLSARHIDGMFGFDRLSIKDLSREGHQPMLAPNGKAAVIFNGEIYNDEMLRDEMLAKGYAFKSATDTEVILALYLEYGFEIMLSKLNGMFAIAIVDLRKHDLWLARDRYGIKPLLQS